MRDHQPEPRSTNHKRSAPNSLALSTSASSSFLTKRTACSTPALDNAMEATDDAVMPSASMCPTTRAERPLLRNSAASAAAASNPLTSRVAPLMTSPSSPACP